MQVPAETKGVHHESKQHLYLVLWPRIRPDDLHGSTHRLLWALSPDSRWQRCSSETTRRGLGRLQNPEQWTGLQLYISTRNRERNVLGTRGQATGLQAQRRTHR